MHTHAYTLLLCLGSAYTETLSHPYPQQTLSQAWCRQVPKSN
uniref:Uncharacterized protein n=1 Tax=Anguilla anguilla TaxID=7936 RepID=A0A0E9SP21_ANGAN